MIEAQIAMGKRGALTAIQNTVEHTAEAPAAKKQAVAKKEKKVELRAPTNSFDNPERIQVCSSLLSTRCRVGRGRESQLRNIDSSSSVRNNFGTVLSQWLTGRLCRRHCTTRLARTNPWMRFRPRW